MKRIRPALLTVVLTLCVVITATTASGAIIPHSNACDRYVPGSSFIDSEADGRLGLAGNDQLDLSNSSEPEIDLAGYTSFDAAGDTADIVVDALLKIDGNESVLLRHPWSASIAGETTDLEPKMTIWTALLNATVPASWKDTETQEAPSLEMVTRKQFR